jgi:LysM repeat protein
VPTATPWPQPPEPIILEPGALTPISEGNGEEDGASGDGTSTPTATEECGDVYIVEAGDVPFSIAEKCGVDVDDLLELNSIDDPTSLFIGQELKIPQ